MSNIVDTNSTSTSPSEASASEQVVSDASAFDQLTSELFGGCHLKDSLGLRRSPNLVRTAQDTIVPLVMALRSVSATLSRSAQFFLVHMVREIAYCYIKQLPDDLNLESLINRSRSILGEAAVAGQNCLLCGHHLLEAFNDSWTDVKCLGCNVPFEVKTTLSPDVNSPFCVGNPQGEAAFRAKGGHFVIFTKAGVKVSNVWTTSTVQKNGNSQMVANLVNPILVSSPFTLTKIEIDTCSKALSHFHSQVLELSVVHYSGTLISSEMFRSVLETAVAEFDTINKVPTMTADCEQRLLKRPTTTTTLSETRSYSSKSDPVQTREVCRNFRRGYCKFGKNCHHLH